MKIEIFYEHDIISIFYLVLIINSLIVFGDKNIIKVKIYHVRLRFISRANANVHMFICSYVTKLRT